MTPELKKELDEMEKSVRPTGGGQNNWSPDPRVVLTNIHLIRTVDKLDTTSTRLWMVNIGLGILVLLATVIPLFRH